MPASRRKTYRGLGADASRRSRYPHGCLRHGDLGSDSVEQIIELARHNGVPVLIDGAHGPGHLALDLDGLGADFYVGNCHKWLCAAKGAAFIYVRSALPVVDLHPTAISHSYGQGFPLEFDKIGTRDPSAWLTVPDAITFHHQLGGAAMRERNRAVAVEALRRMAVALGTEAGAPEGLFGSLVTVRLPAAGPTTWSAAADVSKLFWDHHRIVIPVMSHSDALWLRLSVAAYVDDEDIERLLAALPDVLRRIS
jgi:isopenicillin-N epimerase